MKKLLLVIFTCLALGATLFNVNAAQAASDDPMRIPIADVSDGQAHFYKADVDGVTVKFFLIKSPDGQIRAAFNACDVCYPEKKGYVQNGQFMVCVNCGQRFALNRIGEIKGGCNPGPLAKTLDDKDVIIAKSDLAQGIKYFK